MEREIKVTWTILINFFNETIKPNLNKFNTPTFSYPEIVKFANFKAHNNKRLKDKLVIDFLEFELSYKLEDLLNINKNLMRIVSKKIGELNSQYSYRIFKFNIPRKKLPKKRKNINSPKTSDCQEDNRTSKRKSRASFDTDYSPELSSREVTFVESGNFLVKVCANTGCKNVREELAKANSKIKELEKEIVNLKQNNTATELVQVKDKVTNKLRISNMWILVCLFATTIRMSTRDVPRLFQFLKNNVKCLSQIYVPQKTNVHLCRFSIKTLNNHQITSFINNSRSTVLALDATAFRKFKILALILYNETKDNILLGMTYLLDGKAVTIAKTVEELLGKNKQIVYSKLKGVLSDTECAQLNADKLIIDEARKCTNNRIFLIKCMLHSVSNCEKYVMDICGEPFIQIIDCFSALFGPISSDFSSTNVNSNFNYWVVQNNFNKIKIEQKIGNRFHFYSHNSRILYTNYQLFVDFSKAALSSKKNKDNSKLAKFLEDITGSQNCNGINILGKCGLVGCFWVYLIRPIFHLFSKDMKLGEAVNKLISIRNFLRNGQNSEVPFSYLTEIIRIFPDLEYSQAELEFSKAFMEGYDRGFLNKFKMPEKVWKEMENLARLIFSRILRKYEADWKHLLDSEISAEDSNIFLPFSNARCESVFGFFKDDAISKNTQITNLIDRTILVFNKTMDYVMELDPQVRMDLIDTSRNNWKDARQSNEETRLSFELNKNETDMSRVKFKREKN